jgi:O-antigen ligase
LVLIAACWLLWTMWAVATFEAQGRNFRLAWVPLTLAVIALVWAAIQMAPFVPGSWAHPLWDSAAEIFRSPVSRTISINPWHTMNEAAKLSAYLAVAWMAFTISQNDDRARLMLNAWIAIGTFYAVYAFVIAILGMQQFRIFYPVGTPLTVLSGPFVQRNSFATYEGLAAIAATARLMEFGNKEIVTTKGMRRLTVTAMKFVFGSGIPLVIATILTVSALIASASRGGFLSTLIALAAMAVISAARQGRERRWSLIFFAAGLGLLLLGLIWISGGLLNARLIDLANAPNGDEVRRALWGAAARMIGSAPLLGLGLGTFQDAYPMYAAQVFPFIMDKAHNDYLEFAAGLGLPAAICWWLAILWLTGKFGRAIFVRKKNGIYPLIGLGATVLVGVHSLIDFSLQMPAVALTYAVLLGLALAQSFSSRALASQPAIINRGTR